MLANFAKIRFLYDNIGYTTAFAKGLKGQFDFANELLF